MKTRFTLAKEETKGPVANRYTEAARDAIFFARSQALRSGRSVVTLSDMLLGILQEENTRADRIAHLKANAFYLRWLLGLPPLPMQNAQSSNDGQSATALDAAPEPVLTRALACAIDEADRDGEYWIDSDHLMRGLLSFPNTAQFALLKIPINLDAVRAASRYDRRKFPAPMKPGATRIEVESWQHIAPKKAASWAQRILKFAGSH